MVFIWRKNISCRLDDGLRQFVHLSPYFSLSVFAFIFYMGGCWRWTLWSFCCDIFWIWIHLRVLRLFRKEKWKFQKFFSFHIHNLMKPPPPTFFFPLKRCDEIKTNFPWHLVMTSLIKFPLLWGCCSFSSFAILHPPSRLSSALIWNSFYFSTASFLLKNENLNSDKLACQNRWILHSYQTCSIADKMKKPIKVKISTQFVLKHQMWNMKVLLILVISTFFLAENVKSQFIKCENKGCYEVIKVFRELLTAKISESDAVSGIWKVLFLIKSSTK